VKGGPLLHFRVTRTYLTRVLHTLSLSRTRIACFYKHGAGNAPNVACFPSDHDIAFRTSAAHSNIAELFVIFDSALMYRPQMPHCDQPDSYFEYTE
jgi:hypothetical protein